MPPPSPHRAAIGHPLTVAAAVLMLVNDLVLRVWSPGWLTGKLSDIGFLVVTPVLLAALVGGRVGVRGSASVQGCAIALTVAVYTTLQLWPPLGQLFSAAHIADAEDLLVLPAVLLAFLCWRPWRWRVPFALPVLGLALVATQGEGSVDETHPCAADPEWEPNLPLLVHLSHGPNTEITDHFVRGIHLHEPDGADLPIWVTYESGYFAICARDGLRGSTDYVLEVGPWDENYTNEVGFTRDALPAVRFRTLPGDPVPVANASVCAARVPNPIPSACPGGVDWVGDTGDTG